MSAARALVVSLAALAVGCSATVDGSGGEGDDPPGADAGPGEGEADAAAPALDHCAVGPAADPASACAQTVCAAMPACCESGWGEACVFEALISCEAPCPATGLHAIEPSLAGYLEAHPMTSQPVGVVQPVLVVPSDLADNPDLPQLQRFTELAAREGQGLYAAATGATVRVLPLRVVAGSMTNAEYQAGDGAEARRDAIEGSGRQDRDQIAWIVWLGGGAHAGAYGESPGFDLELSAMIGAGSFYTHLAHVTGDLRWCDHILEETFADACRAREWIITAGMGAFVHELGHSLGLSHEDDHDGVVPETSFMTQHWNYFQIRSPETAGGALSEEYKARIRASRFAAPAP